MNQLDFEGRSAVITGGAQGIGLAVAQRLAASGARVALWDQDERALAAAKAALGAAALPIMRSKSCEARPSERPFLVAPSTKIVRCLAISSGFFLPIARRRRSAPPSV